MIDSFEDDAVDPELDRLLRRALGAGSLSRERRERQLRLLGLPVSSTERTATTSTLTLPAGKPRTLTYTTSNHSPRRHGREIELASGALGLMVIAGLLALLYRDGDRGAGPTPEATGPAAVFATATASPNPGPYPTPTSTATPAIAGCDLTAWTFRDILPALTDFRWVAGERLSLGRAEGRFMVGENSVLWLAAFPDPNNAPAEVANISLVGTRLGAHQWPVQLEQRHRRIDDSTQIAHNVTGVRSSIVFPAAGCWQIDAEVGSATLRAVVNVEPDPAWETSEAVWDALRWRSLDAMGIGTPPNCVRTAPRLRIDDLGPLVGEVTGTELPAYLAGPDELGAIHLPATSPEQGGYYARVLFVTSHDYQGPLLVRAIPDSAPIAYSMHSPDPQPARELRLPGPGCYALKIDGLDFRGTIVFEAVQDPMDAPAVDRASPFYTPK